MTSSFGANPPPLLSLAADCRAFPSAERRWNGTIIGPFACPLPPLFACFFLLVEGCEEAQARGLLLRAHFLVCTQRSLAYNHITHGKPC